MPDKPVMVDQKYMDDLGHVQEVMTRVQDKSPRAGMVELENDKLAIHQVCVGLREGYPPRVCYPLHKTLEGRLEASQETPGSWVFTVNEFSPPFDRAEGRAKDAALEKWAESIHVWFQRLRATLDILRTEDELVKWDSLRQHLDVAAYEAACPVKMHQRGKVTAAFPEKWAVWWADGSDAPADGSDKCKKESEDVYLDVMPDEFAAFEEGDWFEALLERHPETWKIQYVHEVRPCAPPSSDAADRDQSFWQSLAQKTGLPESGRDWTKS